MKRRLRPIVVLVILAFALAGAIATYILWASDKGVALWIQLLLFIADIIVLAGFLLSFDEIWDLFSKGGSKRGRAPRDDPFWTLLNVRKWPLFVAAFANAIMFSAAIIPFLNPGSAVESEHGIIERLTRKNETLLEQRLPAPAPTPILKLINGLWGHDECRTAYQFSLVGLVLHIERVAADPGAPPYKRTGTVIGTPHGYELDTRADDGGADQGMSSTFTVEPGATETLTWDDRNSKLKTELQRCPQPAASK